MDNYVKMIGLLREKSLSFMRNDYGSEIRSVAGKRRLKGCIGVNSALYYDKQIILTIA